MYAWHTAYTQRVAAPKASAEIEAMRHVGGETVNVVLLVVAVAALCAAVVSLLIALRTERRFATVQRASAALANGGLLGLDQVLREQGLQVSQNAERIKDMERRLNGVDAALLSAIRYVGVVRFNAFEDSGGAQSFVVALLNSERSGVVLSGLHSRTDTRVYAKPVQRGVSRYALSTEESKALENAMVKPVELAAP